MDDCFPEEWSVLRQWLPENLEQTAKDCGFMRRARGVQDAEVWLRLILLHAGGGLSLEQAVMRAAELGLARVSGVALHKRLLRAGPWLQQLTSGLVGRRAVPRLQEGWHSDIVVVDATSVHEPGSTGTDWRVHYRMRLSDLQCEGYELTDAAGGESLGRHPFRRAQVVVADRGYCHRAGAAHVLERGAHLVLRLHPVVFPLEDAASDPFDLIAWARKTSRLRAIERRVWFRHGPRRYQLRLCAIRKSRTATQRAQKRQRLKASRAGRAPDPQSVALAEYVLVLTSLPAGEWPTARVLKLYRYRWQVELVFKRLKSLLGLGHLPKTNDRSARAWMQAKILTALLIERAMYEARFFSPWGHALAGEPMGLVPHRA